MITLTEAQRHLFIAYLKQETESNKKLIPHTEKISPITAKKLKQETIAYIVVAGILESIEEMNIGE